MFGLLEPKGLCLIFEGASQANPALGWCWIWLFIEFYVFFNNMGYLTSFWGLVACWALFCFGDMFTAWV